METITSFKCSFCGKLYVKKNSCQSHEYKCYFNPRTKSCASCTFLRHDSYKYKPDHYYQVTTCMKGDDVTKSLKTNCSKYFSKTDPESKIKFAEAELYYDPIPLVTAYILTREMDISNTSDATETSPGIPF